MNLLAPAMLAGAAALAVPVILHLIARHRFPVQDFPTIRMLQFERRANVFAWKLVDTKQLLLRLLVLALLVAAMARLFAPWLSSEPAPRNLVVVLDASASMRMETPNTEGGGKTTLLELARRRAAELLGEIGPASQCAVVAAGETIQLLRPLGPGSAGAAAGLEAVTPADGTGPGLVRAVATACRMLRGRREVRSQIVVLTDLRRSAFEARDQWDLKALAEARADLGGKLQLALLDVSGEAGENLAITDAHVRGGQVRAGDDVHVIAHVVNSGTTTQPADLRLALGGQADPQRRSIPLPPGGEAFVDMTSRVNRAHRMFAEVSLRAPDALPIDDRFTVPVDVTDVRRVLIVRAPDDEARPVRDDLGKLGSGAAGAASRPAYAAERIDGATILRYVLNPGRELGAGYSSGIDPTVVTADALGAQPLSKYDLVILYDVNALGESALVDLDTFVRQGKSILIVCSARCNPLRFNRTMAAGAKGRAPLSPARIGNDRLPDPPVGIDPQATGHPVLAPFRDRLRGDLGVIRFAAVREVLAVLPGATVALRATDGAPLAVERKAEHGRVMLLAFGVELGRGNIARSRAFPAIMWRLADYLTGRLKRRPPDVLPAGEMRILDVSEPPFAFETALDLRPLPAAGPAAKSQPTSRPARTRRVTIGPERQVVLDRLPAGRFILEKPQGPAAATHGLSYARLLAVNGDPRESRMARIPRDELLELLGPETTVLTPDRLGELVPRGGEFWAILVAVLLVAYAAEALAGWLASLRSQRRWAAEGAP